MKTFYVQTSKENIVTDIITYPHNGYMEIELETPLQHPYHNGDWKLINGVFEQINQSDTEEKAGNFPD